MVRCVPNPVQRRVAHVEVRRPHVDLRAQDVRAVGKLTRPHAGEQIEILLNGSIAVRAVLTRRGERAAVRADLVGIQAVDVRFALPDQLDGEPIQPLEVVGCVQLGAPLKAKTCGRDRGPGKRAYGHGASRIHNSVANRAGVSSPAWATRRSAALKSWRSVSQCGIATVFMPAARAAVMPGPESSTAIDRVGSTPSRRAASRYTSGAGLRRATSSPVTIASNNARTPMRSAV